MKYKLILPLLMLCSCDGANITSPVCADAGDIRHKIFIECLNIAVKQPEHNNEDNNGHVVVSCDNTAYYQTITYCNSKKQKMP